MENADHRMDSLRWTVTFGGERMDFSSKSAEANGMKDLTEGICDAIAKLEHDADPLDVAMELRVLVSQDLLPCPCCGTMPELIGERPGQWQVRCPECCLTTGVGDPDVAAKAWNRRVPHD